MLDNWYYVNYICTFGVIWIIWSLYKTKYIYDFDNLTQQWAPQLY